MAVHMPHYEPFGEHLEDPYGFYAQARSEYPVYFDDRLQAFVLTRYDDIVSVLRQGHIFSSRDTLQPARSFTPAVYEELRRGFPQPPVIINADGDHHRKMREPVIRALAPERIASKTIRDRAHRLIDSFWHEGQTDLVSAFASPLAVETILSLYGIPESDMTQCKWWSDTLNRFLSAPLSENEQVQAARDFVDFQFYFATRIMQRRNSLGNDLMSEMIRAGFDEPTLIHNLLGILMAAHETTAHAIGNGVVLLLHARTPNDWHALRENPGMIPGAVEEILRYDSSVQVFRRTALTDTQIRTVSIPKGSHLLLLYGAANRDPTRFEHSETFDPHRSPNPHLAFGRGEHLCAGAYLARTEVRIALEVLSERFPSLLLKEQILSHIPTLMFRGYHHLLVEWPVYDTAKG